VIIEPDLRIAGKSNAYCIGDVSADRENPLPQLGSVAKQQGIAVAHAIRRQLKGDEPKPFKYEDMGTMAMIRHNAATVDIGSSTHTVNGPVAFTMWLGLHAYLLPGEEHRVQAVRSWAYELMTGKSKYLLK
jgi:NADH dehydrogenase